MHTPAAAVPHPIPLKFCLCTRAPAAPAPTRPTILSLKRGAVPGIFPVVHHRLGLLPAASRRGEPRRPLPAGPGDPHASRRGQQPKTGAGGGRRRHFPGRTYTDVRRTALPPFALVPRRLVLRVGERGRRRGGRRGRRWCGSAGGGTGGIRGRGREKLSRSELEPVPVRLNEGHWRAHVVRVLFGLSLLITPCYFGFFNSNLFSLCSSIQQYGRFAVFREVFVRCAFLALFAGLSYPTYSSVRESAVGGSFCAWCCFERFVCFFSVALGSTRARAY